MSRVIGTAALLLLICAIAPAIARAADAAVPILAWALVLLVIWRLAFSQHHRRW